MNSQHQIIINILSDGQWHCTSEMRSEYMADPPKRLQELRDEKGYKFYEPEKCDLHTHRGGVKKWKLVQQTYNGIPVKVDPSLKPRQWHLKPCCYSFKQFQTHGSECPTRTQPKQEDKVNSQLTIF